MPVSVVAEENGQVWHGRTGSSGEIYFLVPKGKKYRIDGGAQEGLKNIRLPNATYVRSSFGVTYVADMFSEKTEGDSIFQDIDDRQAPTRTRVLTKIKVYNFSEVPLSGEVLFFSTKKSGKTYIATADEKGHATLMLPKGDTFCLSTSYVRDVDCFYLKKDEFAQTLRLTYHTIGTIEFKKREAERARMAAIRDSIYREMRARDSIRMTRDSLRALAGDSDFMHMLKFRNDPAQVERLVKQRAEKERDLIAEDPEYFEKVGEEVKAVLYRMRTAWAKKVIVTDITGSMYPFMDQVLVWHALQLTQGEDNRYLFFNDGDDQPDNHEALGRAGGIYHTDAEKMMELMKTMETGMRAGYGGKGPENDIEALLAGEQKLRELDELILIADNYSDVWDIELLESLKVPVHVILAGADYGVNEQYLEIAYRTGGTVHTLKQDIENLSQLADGKTIRIGEFTYRVSKGKFIKVEGI